MKKEILFSCLLLMMLLPGQGWAQYQENMSASNIIAMMMKSMKLGAKQVKEVNPVVTEFVNKLRVIKANKGISQDIKKRQIAEAEDDMEDQLKHYLTEEQLALWHAMMVRIFQEAKKQDSERLKVLEDFSSHKNLPDKDDGVLQSDSSKTKNTGIY